MTPHLHKLILVLLALALLTAPALGAQENTIEVHAVISEVLIQTDTSLDGINYTAQGVKNADRVVVLSNPDTEVVISSNELPEGTTLNAVAKRGTETWEFAGNPLTIKGVFPPSEGVSVQVILSRTNNEIAYTVEHYQQNLAGGYPAKAAETETKTGKATELTKAEAKTYEGFTAQTVTQQAIKGDGSTVVKIYYTRNQYQMIWVDGAGSELKRENVLYEAAPGTAPASSPTLEGYTFKEWEEAPAAMPAHDVIIHPEWIRNEVEPVQPEPPQTEKVDDETVKLVVPAPTSGTDTTLIVNPADTTQAIIKDTVTQTEIKVTFEDEVTINEGSSSGSKEVSGTIKKVEVSYTESKMTIENNASEISDKPATYSIVIEMQTVTEELPEINPHFDEEIKKQAKKEKADFTPIAMITATASDDQKLAEINTAIGNNGKVIVSFTIAKEIIDQIGLKNVRVMHMKNGKVKDMLNPSSIVLNKEGTHYIIEAKGNGFSNYILGAVPPEKPAASGTQQGTSVWLTETPTPTPTATPTATPTGTAPTPTATPTQGTETESPLSVTCVLAGLAAAVMVLRRR